MLAFRGSCDRPMANMKPAKSKDFRTQARNANGHTDEGMAMLESSIEEVGWFGAISVAADGEVFDGSARQEVVSKVLPEDAVVYDSDGTKPIYIRRVDIPNAQDPRAVKAGILANRVAEKNLSWESVNLDDISQDVDLGDWFAEEVLADLIDELDTTTSRFTDDPDKETPSIGEGGTPLAIVLSSSELKEWQVMKEVAGTQSDKTAFLKLMRGEI
ncbi:hypothetical protein H6F75_00355 [Nodosilinea sp. FACHB-131]|uniref:hypothetical protein n=1 Tax=Cyanophyceae TaxID=3028117 RepID=UPI001688568E|nr:hypothetical protein [Nodosilinea sp. FACHB-131]MBD1871921.1 hypothetical protein [Nodosilinea sp. FACHB-131]